MVRACSFTNLRIGPWGKFEPSAIEQFWPNTEPFADVWPLTYFCMATCSLLAIHRSMEANFQQYFCWVVDFIFQQVFFCKSVESFSVQLWFAPFMIVSAFRELSHCPKFANEKCFFSVEPNIEASLLSTATQQTPGISQLWVSTGLSISGKQYHCVGLLRSWLDFYSMCSQFVSPDSGEFLAQLRFRCGIPTGQAQ